MSKDLIHALNSTLRPRVTVVGDVILDRYVYGDVSRVSREAPIPILRSQREEAKLGGAANVAANLVTMGADCALLTVLGADAGAKLLKGLCKATKGLMFRAVEDAGRPTTVKTRIVAQQQQVLRVDEEVSTPLEREVEAQLLELVAKQLHDTDVVILSDYGRGVLTDSLCQLVIKGCNKRGIPVLVDPKGLDYTKYTGATAITPNRHEAEEASGIPCDSEENIRRCTQHLKQTLNLQSMVVTLGPGGVAVLTPDDDFVRIPTIARSVFDVTGAGDTFIATVATFLGQKLDVVTACRLANTAAGISVGRFGCAAISRHEVRRAVLASHEDYDHLAKIVTIDDLLPVVSAVREAGRKVVFTNGCFDLLHAGHVTYLNFCKGRGDVLIVGLNSDASVKRLGKGDDRPVNHEEDRARVLAALADIDYITVFDEDTPEKLIRRIRPDVMIKGADWEGKVVPGADFVRKQGGSVVFAPLLEGRSTTAILRKTRAGEPEAKQGG